MTEIKVGSIFACSCDEESMPYFVTAYRTQFPNSIISTNGYDVEWWDLQKRFVVHPHKERMKIYGYDIVDGKYVVVNISSNRTKRRKHAITSN